MQIHVAVRIYDHEQSVYVGTSREDLERQVAAYCREQPIEDWDTTADAVNLTVAEILALPDAKVVKIYFADAHKESIEFHSKFMDGRFVPMAPDFRFELGKTYPTLEGKLVKVITMNDEQKGYETVQGDDRADEMRGHRYNRTTGKADHGRVTGSPDDCPRNLIPVAINDHRLGEPLGRDTSRFRKLSSGAD